MEQQVSHSYGKLNNINLLDSHIFSFYCLTEDFPLANFPYLNYPRESMQMGNIWKQERIHKDQEIVFFILFEKYIELPLLLSFI